MSPRDIVSEAWRNLTTGTTGAAIWAPCLALIITMLASLDIGAIGQLVTTAHQWNQAGASLLTVTAPGHVDGVLCDALGTLPSIRAAGAIRAHPAEVRAVTTPSSSIPVHAVTTGFVGARAGAQALLPTQTVGADPGIFAGPEVVDRYTLTPGGTLGVTLSGTFTQAHIAGTYVYPADGRQSGLAYAIVAPEPPGPHSAPFDQCWVDAPKSDPNHTATLLRSTVIPSAGPQELPAEVTQVNASLGTELDLNAFNHRPTRLIPIAAGVAAFAVGWWITRRRRLEMASSLHAGMDRASLVTQTAIETGIWAAMACMIAYPLITLSIHTLPAQDIAPLTTRTGLYILQGFTFTLAGALLAASTIKEKHLFNYFKDR
jgi:hypothetical protein